MQAIRRLARRQRAVVVVRYTEDQTKAGTAGLMGCSVCTANAPMRQSPSEVEAGRRHPCSLRREELAVNPDDPRSRTGRHAVAASVGTTGLMLAVLAGLASCSGRDDAGARPAKTSEPAESTAVDVARPLVYAEGSTIHYGDRTYDAGRVVEFVEATDDGFVFVTENDGRRLYFTDGSYVPDRIDLVAPGQVGEYPVLTANPGSLVAWEYAPIPTAQREIVVYDTDRREIVTSPLGDSLVAVNGERVYWRRGGDLMRFDNSTGTQEAVSWGSLRADLASNPRMLVIGRPSYNIERPEVMAPRLAYFNLGGRRLVATDSISRGVDGNTTEPTTLADGRRLRLTVPQGYEGAEESLAAVQWLDDDHLVLFAYHEHNEFPRHVGEFLACPVPTGTCRVVVPASETPYVPPGDVP